MDTSTEPTLKAPTVQSLDEIITGLNPVYAQQEGLLAEQMAAIPEKYKVQRMGIDAAKVTGFNDINTQATGRGMSFSGIPLNEQATYLSEKYLPGMQALVTQENTDTMGLRTSLAGLAAEKRLKAMDTRTGQQTSLDTYLERRQSEKVAAETLAKEQAFQESQAAALHSFNAEQTRLQNEWDAQQTALKLAATEKENNAQRIFDAEQGNLNRANAVTTAGINNYTEPEEDVTTVRNAAGGWDVYVDGQPSKKYDLATAAQLSGQSIVSLLANGSATDRAAYAKWVASGGKNADGSKNNEILRTETGAFYLGGPLG